MTISLQRFEQLLDAYGASPQRWPAHERVAALQLLEQSPQAVQLMQHALWLDQQLDQLSAPDFLQLGSQILQQPLPARRKSLIEQLLAWLLPLQQHSAAVFWRPAALACVPLMLGLVLGNQLDFYSDAYADELYSDELEETELDLISLADYSEIL
ncbi:hypothetical protein E3V39_13445 [Gammaproteobacteria bacterium LSUCC0112]|nr:hypothetical protein E3V39_13445 [Gammaproteobacteria bacterium LSUCC0112]